MLPHSTDIVILHETGTVGWASMIAPKKVMVNTLDATDSVQKNGELYTLPLPETAEKAVISLSWQ